MEIIDFIPFGKKNAVSRHDLMTVTGCPDRAVRHMIAEARREHCILNAQDGNGYYRPTDAEIDAVKRFIKQESNRAKSIFWSLRAARKFVKETGE